MKEIKRKSKKYPIKVKLSNGKTLIVPKQNEFDNDFLNDHGCSIMAEYIALQWGGIKKWPIHILKWHKKHTPNEIFSKVTIRGVREGIEEISRGKLSAKYHKTVTAKLLKTARDEGNLVILEQGDPIHTVVLVPDENGYFMLSHGKVSKTSVTAQAKKATKNERYRGMIIVKDRRKG